MSDQEQKVTQEMLDENPALAEAGVQVGDPIVVAPKVEVPEAPKDELNEEPKPADSNE